MPARHDFGRHDPSRPIAVNAPLAPAVLDELGETISRYSRTLPPPEATRLIVNMAEQQPTGREMRGLFLSIAAVALVAAARVAELDPSRYPTRSQPASRE